VWEQEEVMRFVVSYAVVFAAVSAGTARPDDRGKPLIKVTADGFPAGHDTPEGAACDLARAFIKRDVRLFRDACIKPFSGGKSRAEYTAFLRETAEAIQEEARRKRPSPEGPKQIAKLFAARALSRTGPANYGRAAFGFRAVRFVDVGVILHNGNKNLNRTLVIKDKSGRWYAHPLPDSSPLLSTGLNDEGVSRMDFREVYRIEK
jgi:hypothetical protein